MEAAILAAEETVAARQADGGAGRDRRARGAGRRPAARWKRPSSAVERLYARWQELEAKRA